MKILITGADGQLGSEWIHFLADSRHEGFGYGSNELDITDKMQIEQKIDKDRPDVIINCAAYTAVDKAEENIKRAFEINEKGALYLAEACKRAGIKLVHYSTDYVFEGSQQDMAELPGGYAEHHPANPQNVYGESKLAGEQAVERTGGNWIIIRVSWLCGQFGNNFIKMMLRLSASKKELQVVNDQTGSPTFCSDLTKKSLELVEMDQKGYFHISSEGAVTWYDLTEELLKQTGRAGNVKLKSVSSAQFASKAKRPAFSLLNCERLKKTGLEQLNWKDGLSRLLSQITIGSDKDED